MPGLLDTLFPVIGKEKSKRERREMENALLRDSMDARNEMVDLLGRQVPGRVPGRQIPEVVAQNPQQVGMPEINLPGKKQDGYGYMPAYQTPQGQQKLVQLMSRMGPDGMQAAMGAAMPQTNERTNTLEQKWQTANAIAEHRGLQGQERQDFIDSIIVPRGGVDGATLLATELQKERLEDVRLSNAAAAEEQRSSLEQQQIAERSRKAALRSTMRNVKGLVADNQFLSGTFLRPGWAAEQRKGIVSLIDTAGRFFGADTSGTERMLQSYTGFEKGTANLLQDLAQNLKGMDTRTDNRLEQIIKSLANITNEPGTNAKILGENVYDILDVIEVNQIDMPEEEVIQWESLAENLKQFGSTRSVRLPSGEWIDDVPLHVSDDEVYAKFGS